MNWAKLIRCSNGTFNYDLLDPCIQNPQIIFNSFPDIGSFESFSNSCLLSVCTNKTTNNFHSALLDFIKSHSNVDDGFSISTT